MTKAWRCSKRSTWNTSLFTMTWLNPNAKQHGTGVPVCHPHWEFAELGWGLRSGLGGRVGLRLGVRVAVRVRGSGLRDTAAMLSLGVRVTYGLADCWERDPWWLWTQIRTAVHSQYNRVLQKLCNLLMKMSKLDVNKFFAMLSQVDADAENFQCAKFWISVSCAFGANVGNNKRIYRLSLALAL